jgi:hypothetical protein
MAVVGATGGGVSGLQVDSASRDLPVLPEPDVVESLASLRDLPPRVFEVIDRSRHECFRDPDPGAAERTQVRFHGWCGPPDIRRPRTFRPSRATMHTWDVLLGLLADRLGEPTESTLSVFLISRIDAGPEESGPSALQARLGVPSLPENRHAFLVPVGTRVVRNRGGGRCQTGISVLHEQPITRPAKRFAKSLHVIRA